MARKRAAARGCVALGGALASLVALAACSKGSDAPSKGAVAPTTAALAEKPFYRVDAAPLAPCAAGAVCEAKVELRALGAYHVNKDYPFKFEGAPAAPALEGPATFKLDDEKRGTLTIRFRAAAAGTANVAGTFKLSVCSEDTCEIEKPQIAIAVPVT